MGAEGEVAQERCMVMNRGVHDARMCVGPQLFDELSWIPRALSGWLAEEHHDAVAPWKTRADDHSAAAEPASQPANQPAPQEGIPQLTPLRLGPKAVTTT
jgi:hypothetical protein